MPKSWQCEPASCRPRLRYLRGKAYVELPIDDLPCELHAEMGTRYLRIEKNCVLAEKEWLINHHPRLLPSPSQSVVCGTLVCADHHLVRITQRAPGYYRLENPYGPKWVQLAAIKGGDGWISPRSLAIRSELPFAFSLRGSVKMANLGKGGADQGAIFSSRESQVLVALHVTDEDFVEMAWCPSAAMAQAIVASYRCVGGRPSVAINQSDLDASLRRMVKMGLFPTDGHQAWIDLEFLKQHWPEELGVDRHPVLGIRRELLSTPTASTPADEIQADDHLELGQSLKRSSKEDTPICPLPLADRVAKSSHPEVHVRTVFRRVWDLLHTRVMGILGRQQSSPSSPDEMLDPSQV